MATNFKQFKGLHESPYLFVLPNVWNVKSANLLQEKNAPAIATSSAAVADSLGYKDGEGMPFEEYLFVIRRILSSVQIPVSVDMEMGYAGSREEIYQNMLKLIDLGVAGINIEDSAVDKSNRVLKDATLFARTIEYIKNKLASDNLDLFINVRCDTFLLHVDNKQQETKNRLRIYEAAGADGIFLPCIAEEEDILEAVSTTQLPLNVMCIPGLPGFEALERMGVKRVSMGPFLFSKVYDTVGTLYEAAIASESFLPLVS